MPKNRHYDPAQAALTRKITTKDEAILAALADGPEPEVCVHCGARWSDHRPDCERPQDA